MNSIPQPLNNMSSNESSDGEPLANGAITPPPPDIQHPPLGEGESSPPPPGWQPAVELPQRPITQQPARPHPNFWWSILWCLLFLLATQVPGVALGAVVLVVVMLINPQLLPPGALSDQATLLKSEPVAAVLAVVFLFTEALVVGFSLLILRLVVGRDWMRQVALRRPSMAHTLLALASFPALVLLGNVAYELLRNSGWVPSIASDGGPIKVFYFWIAVILVLGGAMLASLPIGGPGWTQRLATRPARPADVLLALVVLVGLVPIIVLIYEGLRRGWPIPGLEGMKIGGMEEMVEISTKWPLGFAILVIGLGPGIGEELWCRAFLGRGLVGNYGAVLGVVAASFFFGIIHVDPCQGTMAMVMGLWLHFVYLTTRSLWLPMMLHFANNSLGVIAPRVPQLAFLDAKPWDISPGVYFTAGLLMVAVIYALLQSRTRLQAELPEQQLLWRPAFAGVEYPPADSGMQVVHPAPAPAAVLLTLAGFVLFVAACVFGFGR